VTRSDKLHLRLARLESDLLQALIREFRDEIGNRPSRYLMRKGPYITGRQYRTAESDHLESLERQVLSLRRKLQEDVPGPVLAAVEEFAGRVQAAVKPWEGGRVSIAKDILARLRTA